MQREVALVGLTAAVAIVCLLAWAAPPAQAGRPGMPEGAMLQRRWFFCFGYGRNRQDVDEIKSLVRTAADHGLNGMVLSSFGLDGITLWSEKDFALLREVQDVCREEGIELIPTGFSVGYGGAALDYDPNFAAALPVSIRLEARGGKAVPVAGGDLLINGDLEQHEGASSVTPSTTGRERSPSLTRRWPVRAGRRSASRTSAPASTVTAGSCRRSQ
jgi:hypothetical protein